MQIVLTITAETARELNTAISELHGEIYQIKSPNPAVLEGEIQPVEEKKAEPVKRTRTAKNPEIKEPDPVITEATKPTEITMEDIRALLAEKSEAGKRTEAKALLNIKFGAPKLQALVPEKYPDFMAELKAL